jgi:hypothetical protein
MGMTKAALDFQLQQETQKAIGVLQKNVERLEGICRVIDGNMRQAHMMAYQDIMQLRIRINFILDELKKANPEIDERFKQFAAEAAKQMEKEVAAAIEAREKAQAEKKIEVGGPGSENTPNVVQ